MSIPVVAETQDRELNDSREAAAAASADVHPPADVHQSRRKPLGKLALEVARISAGVFLGLAGDQWRENAGHRELAKASLRRFRAEILTNRAAVAEVREYHVTALRSLRTYLAADRRTRNTADVPLRGLQPVAFEHTAWDVALATQSLAYVDPEVAFALSRIYNEQQGYAELTRGVTQAMYLLPRRENFDAFAEAVEAYFSDLVILEPRLVRMYDDVLPRIDHALGEPSAARRSSP